MQATVTKEFDSISAIARYCDTTEQHRLCARFSTDHSSNADWDLRTNFDDALKMASEGGLWEQGAKDLMKSHIEMAAMKDGRVSSDDYSVVGHTLDIGAYLANQPDCWIGEGEDESVSNPIITIGVQCGRSGGCTSGPIMNRGAAILSVIDSLESQNHRVELSALWCNQGSGATTNFRTVVKAAHDSWSPAAVAFALCHPAFNRRLMFNVAETFGELNEFTSNGYGVGLHDCLEDEFDLFIPWQSGDGPFRTAAKALATVQSDANNALSNKRGE